MINKKILFLIIILASWSYTLSVQAAGCGFMCGNAGTVDENGNPSKPSDVCTAIGGAIGTTFGSNPQCIDDGSKSCGTNQVMICCCTSSDNPIAPGGAIGNPTKEAPKFNIPVLEVEIPTVKLTEVQCVPNDDESYNCAIPWIGEYINGIYKYGINIAGILAALVLMGGGLLWLISGGDASKITQAKDMIIGSITGLIILMSSYIILTQVNPDLIKMKSISTGYLTKDIAPPPENTADFASKCKPTTTGACAVANMSIFGNRDSQASAICMAESGGNASISNKTTGCTNGGFAVWGLFQFNLSANEFIDENGKVLKCPTAFNKVWRNKSPSCTIVNTDLYNACVKAASNPQLSILNAYRLAANGWGPWEANSKWCNF